MGHAGAFDLPACRLANALAGNPPDACVLEITLLGPTLKFHADAWIALAGAPLDARMDGGTIPMWAPSFVREDSVLGLGAIRQGCRVYLAVHGGFDFEPVLGSRSLDVNAGLGPLGRPLRSGDMLQIGETRKHEYGGRRANPAWSIDPRSWFEADQERPLRLLPGTHAPRLEARSRESLYAQSFRVAAESNRVGYRLEGEPLEFQEPIEMVSEACLAGTLQLPPSGQPIALGVEHPVSGGYPRIGQIAAVDLPRLAQHRPGDALRFAPCGLDEARHALREREQQLHEMEAVILRRLAGEI